MQRGATGSATAVGDNSMLKGKTAIVTGSTSGIGLGIATALAAEGCDVMLNGFGELAAIEKARAGLAERHRVRAGYVAADMAKPAEIRELVDETARRFGTVDILVNNAGIQHVAKIVEFPEERWDAVVAINLSAAFHATKAALPLMIARRWGRIINIASAHGLVASGEKAAYVAAKHGLVGLTKVAAIETANQGITCNAICPGWVLTPLVEQQIAARAKAQGIPVEQAREDLVREKQPMLDYTTPEKIGAFAVFLCGEAASTITGAALSIDGGWVAQ
jgi:3-hydroxybutyrate dehydrogenase